MQNVKSQLFANLRVDFFFLPFLILSTFTGLWTSFALGLWKNTHLLSSNSIPMPQELGNDDARRPCTVVDYLISFPLAYISCSKKSQSICFRALLLAYAATDRSSLESTFSYCRKQSWTSFLMDRLFKRLQWQYSIILPRFSSCCFCRYWWQRMLAAAILLDEPSVVFVFLVITTKAEAEKWTKSFVFLVYRYSYFSCESCYSFVKLCYSYWIRGSYWTSSIRCNW